MSDVRYLRAHVPRITMKAHIDRIFASGLDPFEYCLKNDILVWSYATEHEWDSDPNRVTVFCEDKK